MQLIVRLVAGGHPDGHDLALDVPPGHRVDELIEVVAEHVGGHVSGLWCRRTGEALAPGAAVTDSALICGDELVIGEAPAPDLRRRASAAVIDVISGPDSGRSFQLAPGAAVIGRSVECDIVLDDPAVSRRHARVDLCVGESGTELTIESSPSASGPVVVDGVAVDDRRRLMLESKRPVVCALGDTVLTIRARTEAAAGTVDQLGQIDFQRTPYRPIVLATDAAEPIGPIPTRPEPRRFQVLSVLAPLAAGVLMYAFSKQIQFLALTLVSPIVMVATAIDDRRSGRRRGHADVARFERSLDEHRAALEATRHEERLARLRAAPDLAELARRADTRAVELWERNRAAPDFLRVRVGLCRLPTAFTVEVATGGESDLRAEAESVVAEYDWIDDVPVTVDLADAVCAIHGDAVAVEQIANSLVIQAATLHSPDDLAIVAALPPGGAVSWLKWLPHVRSVVSPVSGRPLVDDPNACGALVEALLDVAVFRTPADAAQRQRAVWPRVLFVVAAELVRDAPTMARLLDLGPAAGISVVWLADRAGAVPHQAGAVLDLGHDGRSAGQLWTVDPEQPTREVDVERLRGARAAAIGRTLAPLRDASTSSRTTSIPRVAPLLDVLGVSAPDSEWVIRRWLTGGAERLDFAVGLGPNGPFELDLVHDGPHALIGGTSGSGKSELLQSMVASLASRHAPDRLNFLFVDYKGGAASKVFEALPHTVGCVTNLDAELAGRALVSLRAELNRRMALLEGRAKDLAELLARAPADAPASLVIVVDEFATLVKEVPEFVAGIIDIAQRGRSLGIHLVLATQRPSGSVNENILANTNLRIALRVLDRSESTAIIGSNEAADIPVPLRGRALARLGPQRLVEFQSAYAGAPVASAGERSAIRVTDFVDPIDIDAVAGAGGQGGSGGAAASGPSHLDLLLAAIASAATALRIPPQPRPWRDVLPEVVTLDALDQLDPACRPTAGEEGRRVPLGLVDAPEQQAQHPLVVDLEQGGGLLVYGSGGSGRTTLLRTVAVGLGAHPEAVEMIALDGASRGLLMLRQIRNVVDVATADDLEAVTRQLLVLEHELDRRRDLLAAAHAEHLTAYNAGHPQLRRIVVLIDGIGAVIESLSSPSGGFGVVGDAWSDRLVRIAVEGRQVGIHVVIAAERRNAVPSRLQAAIANRLILAHADDNSYLELGVPLARTGQLASHAGRALWNGTHVVQLAVPGPDPSATGQHAACRLLAERAAPGWRSTIASSALPTCVALDALPDRPAASATQVAIGIHDVTGAPVSLDLTWSHAVVFGPPRSGRSTTLRTIVAQLAAHHELIVIGSASSVLADCARRGSAFGGASDVAPVLDRLCNVLAMGRPTRPTALVVDDLDLFDDPTLASYWERLAQPGAVRVVAAVESRSMSGFTVNPLLATLRRSRQMVALMPDDPAEFLQITGVRLPLRPGLHWVAGRGVAIADRVPVLTQIADVAPADGLAGSLSATDAALEEAAVEGAAEEEAAWSVAALDAAGAARR